MITTTSKAFGLKLALCLILLLGSILETATAATVHMNRNPEVKQFIDHMVAKHGFSRFQLYRIFNRAHYDPQVIGKITAPREKLTWERYRDIFITEEATERGLKYWQDNADLLAQEEKRYGVPANIIVALIGVETLYGKTLGTFKALDALATLAFYYPQRGKYFRSELEHFLLFTRQMKIDPTKVPSSYAGALGYCQFMPSAYRTYGISGNEQSQKLPNLFSNQADVILSTGNFLRQHGWEPNTPVATQAQVHGKRYHGLVELGTSKVGKPHLTLATLHKHGITPKDRQYPQSLDATLMLFDEGYKQDYWLGFQNFYAITRYNNSDLYAMAVYRLSQKLAVLRQQQLNQ